MLITLLVILALVALIVGLALRQPTEFRIERSAVILAPAATVFPHVNDLEQWHPWSPWEKLDPDMIRTYAGPAAGVGASYAWDGNGKAGSGRMTITDSVPHERINLRLEFFRPFACTHRAEFRFQPVAGGTKVTWIMAGKNLFMGRVMGVFVSMDRMIGTSFEEGFVNLKRVTETTGTNQASSPPRGGDGL